MHNKYNNGQIYIITAGKLLYVGSTIQELIKRERVHLSECKANKKNCDSFSLLRTGAYKMEWYEDFPCNSKAELHRREGEVMLELMEAHKKDPSLPVVVNRRIAGRTKHEYYEATKDVQLAVQKKAYDADKEKYRARNRAQYAKDPEKWLLQTNSDHTHPLHTNNYITYTINKDAYSSLSYHQARRNHHDHTTTPQSKLHIQACSSRQNRCKRYGR